MRSLDVSAMTGTRAGAYAVSWAGDLDGLGRDGGDLTALLSTVRGSTFFNAWEWTSGSAAALPPRRSLHVLSVRKDGTLVACLALTWGPERIHGLPVRSVRLLGDPLADRVAVPLAPGEPGLGRVLLDALMTFPLPWDAIVLSELVEDRALMALITAWASERGVGLHWRHCARAPIIGLDAPDVGALRATYPRTLQTRLRRSRKRLEAAGAVRFERSTPTPAEVDPLLGTFKTVEDRSWKGRRGGGIFGPPDRFAFFRALSLRIAARGWLDVGLLRLDGRVISYRYGFRFGGVYLDYNLAYDPDYAGLSPGRILLDEMIASSLELGLAAVDASHGTVRDGHQLQEWTERYTDHYQLWLLGGTLRGRALAILRNRVKPGVDRWRASSGLQGGRRWTAS
jgi:CelD/BcsL family acetyltransferase involved in cellulose biosynthesis